MVQIQTGIVVTCDPQMKQFLLHLDDTKALGQVSLKMYLSFVSNSLFYLQKFVLQDLDTTHLLISADIIDTLKNKIDDLMDQFSFIEVN